MPLRHKSAQKRARQTVKRTEKNKFDKARIKSVIKEVQSSKTREEAEIKLKKAVSLLDRYSVKHLIHKNNAANKKSQLVRFVNTLK